MINIGINNTPNEEFIIDIRDKSQVIKARIAIGKDDVHVHKLMSDHYIEFGEFSLPTFELFKRSDYIIWEGEKYIIKEDYQPSEENKFEFKYTLRFDHWTTFLQDATFYYLLQDLEEVEWSLTSNAASHMQHLADNANRYFGVDTFNVGTVEFTEVKYIQYDKTDVWSAANQIAEEYEGEWYLTGTTFHLVKKVSFGAEIDFESEVSVMKMERSEGDDSERYTRILALGSTRNLPANYRETTSGEAVDAIYQQRLRIPASKGSVIDAYPDMSPEEVKEQPVIFEDIYPKRIGTISEVTTKEYTDTDTDTGGVTKWNAFRIKDSGLSFSKDYLLSGVELRLVFQSGPLNGMDFALNFNPDGYDETDSRSQVFEVVRNEDYGKALPNDTLKPTIGSEYVLYGFNIQLVSDLYIPEAEQELYDTAVEWQQDRLKDKSVFECPTVMQYFADNEMDLEIGQKVKLIHSRFEGGSRSSRIQGFEKKLINKYEASYTVGDNASTSWPDRVEESIKTLQLAGNTYQQITSGGTIYLIKQFDQVAPTDFNAYSAKASDAKYLNKQTGGTVQGDTTFQKDVKVQGKVTSNQFGNDTFSSGQFGSGFRAWLAENGQSYAEFDNLLIRREMLVYILTIAEIKSVGGSLLLSLANMTASAVADGGTYWKVSFDSGDGTIPNQFAVDDQVICRKFNGANIKYYWAKVTSIGLDYINISKSDKDGSGVPAIGDEIIQFGNRTNTSRQAAILMSTYGSDAPSFKQYAGINSYDLTGKEVTVISPSGNKFTGDFIIKSTGKTVYQTISDSVSSIQIGGKNILENSSMSEDANKWINKDGVTITKEQSLNDNYSAKFSFSGLTSVRNSHIHQEVSLSKLEKGQQYTYSFYIYTPDASAVDMGIEFGLVMQHPAGSDWNLAPYTLQSGQWIRVVKTFVLREDITRAYFRMQLVRNGTVYYSSPQLEKGNKVTDWGLSQQDIQDGIDSAQTTANAAKTEADKAQTDANTAKTSADNANSLLADIASDNKLVPTEKSSVRQEWNIIAAELSVNNSQADKFSITTEKTSCNSAFQTLANYLNNGTAWSTGIPSWINDANLSVTTDIVGSTFRANWKSYYDARTVLLNAIASKAKDLADAAQSRANSAYTNAATAQATADTAKGVADQAKTDAATADAKAVTANNLLTDIASDDKLVPSEKQDTQLEWDSIKSEYTKNVTQATNFSVSYTTYQTAYNSLNSYITPLLASLTTTSNIIGTTFRSTFKSYYDARTDLLNAIATKAKTLADTAQSKADEAIQRVSITESSLTVLDNKIESKVAQTDFNTLQGRVSTTESNITQQAGQIQSTVEKVEKKNAAYKSYTSASTDHPNVPYSKGDMWITYDGRILQAANTRLSGSFIESDWKDTTKYTDDSAINNLQLGGNNIFRNSSFVDASFWGRIGDHSVSVESGDKPVSSNNNSLKINTTSGSTGSGNYIYQDYSPQLEIGKEYTISFWAKSVTGVSSIGTQIHGSNGATSYSVTSDWKYFTFTFTYRTFTINRFLMYLNQPGTILINSIQLEEGNKASAWSENAQDVQARIDAAQQKANNASTAAQNAQNTADSKNRTFYSDTQPTTPSGGFKVGDLWYKISLSDGCYETYRWNGSTWTIINVNVSKSRIEQTDSRITSVVEKTGIDSLGNGETLYSKINQTASEIRLEVNNLQIGSSNQMSNSKLIAVDAGINNYAFAYRKVHLKPSTQYILKLGSLKKVSGTFTDCSVMFRKLSSGGDFLANNVYVSENNLIRTVTTNDSFTEGDYYVFFYAGSQGSTSGNSVEFSEVMLVEGNKAPVGWSPSQQDIQEEIDAAQTAANNAQSTANTAISNFNNIVSDSILDPSEKQSAKREWTAVQSEYTKNYAQAISYGVSISAYQTAYNSLNSYITPLLANMTTNSNIVATTYINTWAAYYNANVDLLNAITTKAKDTAVNEVKAGITVTSDTVTVFGQQMKVDSDLIANAIQTNKLQVGTKFEVRTDGKIKAVDGEFSGKLTSGEGTIGGFKINAGSMESANAYGSGKFVLYPDNGFIAFIDSNGGVWSGIGANIFPGSSGLRGVARFENTESNTLANYGVYLNVTNSPVNTALYMAAGHISGLAVRTKEINANATLTHDDVFVLVTGNSNKTITLPASPETGKIYYIKKGTGVGTVTVNGNGKPITITGATGGNILDGATAYSMITLIYSGSTWYG